MEKTLFSWLDERLGLGKYAFHGDHWEGHGREAYALHFDDHTIIPDLLKHFDAIVTIAHRAPNFHASVTRDDGRRLRSAIARVQSTMADKINANGYRVTWALGKCEVDIFAKMKIGEQVLVNHIRTLAEIDGMLAVVPAAGADYDLALEDCHRGSIEIGVTLLQDLRPPPLEEIAVLRLLLNALIRMK